MLSGVPLISPQEITIRDKAFIISKLDCISGREIVTQYPLTSLPKVGDYGSNEALMFKLMSFVAVKAGENMIRLTTKELIKNHVPDWEILMLLEAAMMEYNCSFFQNGRASTFFDVIAQKAQAWILKTLTASSARSSHPEKPPFMN